MVKIVNMFIPKTNTFTRPRIKMNPTSITIHETDNTNTGANALAHARLQVNGNRRQASWHFQVDDRKEVYLSIPLNEVAYHAGNRRGNYSSIAIEICVNRDGNYKKAVENTAKVVRYIMKKYPNINKSNIKQHYDWSKKNCPRRLRSGSMLSWKQFLKMIDNEKLNIPPKKSESAKKTSSLNFKIGSKVLLKNSATHYATGERIPNIYKGKLYTVQQVKTNRILLRELYSWVKVNDLTKESSKKKDPKLNIKVGSKILLKTSATKYVTGEAIPNRVKEKVYTVQQIKNNNILLKEIYSWVKKSDVTLTTTKPSISTSNFKVGQKVKIKRTANNYSRSSATIPSKYKGKIYTIQQVDYDDVLIKELYSWVRKQDVE